MSRIGNLVKRWLLEYLRLTIINDVGAVDISGQNGERNEGILRSVANDQSYSRLVFGSHPHIVHDEKHVPSTHVFIKFA